MSDPTCVAVNRESHENTEAMRTHSLIPSHVYSAHTLHILVNIVCTVKVSTAECFLFTLQILMTMQKGIIGDVQTVKNNII